MTNEADNALLDEAELAEFVQKLDAWAETLSPREQEFLRLMLADAADAASQEAGGYVNVGAGVDPDGDVAAFGDGAFGEGVAGAVVGYAMGVSQSESEIQSLPDFADA